MQRLTALDASFLAQERDGAHLHLGATFVLDGPAPAHADVLDHIDRRLARIPRYRQRLAWPPLGLGKPYWIDDPAFRLDYHVRRTALPAPGGQAELKRLVGRVFSQRLDRDKPLWELWVVEGLADDRFAILVKTHHCMVDGISGIDITAALFDLDPAARAPAAAPWKPEPAPGPIALGAHSVANALRTPARLAGASARAASTPRASLSSFAKAAAGVTAIGETLATGEPGSAINGPISPHRAIAWTTLALADLRAIKASTGGTINDVLLATVAGGIGAWLCERGDDPAASRLRACVPVSLRSEQERGALGNRIAGMFCALPVDEPDPIARIQRVSAAMAHLKRSPQSVGADVLANLQEFAPPTILAHASRLQFSSRLYNVLVSNVPGPQVPVHFAGRRVLDMVPVAFLAEDKRLAVVIVSYAGAVCVSLLADPETIDDLEQLAQAIGAAGADAVTATASLVPGAV